MSTPDIWVIGGYALSLPPRSRTRIMEKEKRFCSENVILCRTSRGIYLRDRAVAAEGSMQKRGVGRPGKSWARSGRILRESGPCPSRALFIAHLWDEFYAIWVLGEFGYLFVSRTMLSGSGSEVHVCNAFSGQSFSICT